MRYIIQHIDHLDLFWSNTTGYGDLALATTFSEEEKDNLTPPIGGQWIVKEENTYA
jgi:hypothetical protein